MFLSRHHHLLIDCWSCSITWKCEFSSNKNVYVKQSNPPPKSRSYSMASQGSGSSPLLVHRSNQNQSSLFSWSHTHKGSSLYSSKRSLLPDHLLEAREVQQRHPNAHSLVLESILWDERENLESYDSCGSWCQTTWAVFGTVLISVFFKSCTSVHKGATTPTPN